MRSCLVLLGSLTTGRPKFVPALLSGPRACSALRHIDCVVARSLQAGTRQFQGKVVEEQDSCCMTKPIILWSHPRSVSTAFERAFINRKHDIQCFHEPFGEPFYYSSERMSQRYTQEQCEAGEHKTSYTDVFETIMAAAKKDDGKQVFVKDMSQYIVKPDAKEGENPTVFTDAQLSEMEHSFLIRTPTKSVPSYYRCCSGDQAKETGFDTYDPNEAGYVESVTLFKYLTSLGLHPIIVDSADLIHTPKLIMKAYCAAVNVPWQEGMIEWKAEKVESFDKWKGFHDDAQQSTGFKEVKRDQAEIDGWPQVVRDTIAANMEPYAFLHNHRLQVTAQQ